MERHLKVLNVAEKPSVSKEISRLLSAANFRNIPSASRFNPVHQFNYFLQGRSCCMYFTSVRGHLMALDFVGSCKNWHCTPPEELYSAPVEKSIAEDAKDIHRNLVQYAEKCNWLLLWLDCDREGENIAFEVLQVCTRANPNLKVFRATFSAITKEEIEHACHNLHPPNANLSDAVDVRSEIDLRIGASFTRFFTLRWKGRLQLPSSTISYGPCQSPTLGFVVERYNAVENFEKESFWFLKAFLRGSREETAAAVAAASPTAAAAAGATAVGATAAAATAAAAGATAAGATAAGATAAAATAAAAGATAAGGEREKNCSEEVVEVEFLWDRHRLFDRTAVLALYELCMQQPIATVTALRGFEVSRARPRPLCTVELHKIANRKLRLSSAQCMAMAEKLYQKGIISYPRTETERFSLSMDLKKLIEPHAHAVDCPWSLHAKKLLDGEFVWPADGARDDKAHPPIHPLQCVSREEMDKEEDWKLYELITRHFLACCSDDAIGFETKVDISIAGEGFHASGLVVLDRGWLDVYPYEQWTGKKIPHFVEGEKILPTALLMSEGHTEPPPLLTEADLVGLMDKHGIGTDATMHEHIKTIQDRQYALRDSSNFFLPSQLGLALTKGFQRIGELLGVDLSLPDIRARMEAEISLVAAGEKTKEEVLRSQLSSMHRVFLLLRQHALLLDEELLQRIPSVTDAAAAAASPARHLLQANFSRCGRCDSFMDLVGVGSESEAAAASSAGSSNRRRRQQRGEGISAAAAATGTAGQSADAVVNRFLVCTRAEEREGGCLTRLLLPSKGELSPHPVRCAYCNFQAITTLNLVTKKTHQFCPFCFWNPPAAEARGGGQLRCFACRHPACPLSGRSRG